MRFCGTFLYIKLPDSFHGNYGLEIYSSNCPDLVKEFERLALINFVNAETGFMTFYQGGHCSHEWKYFEFWAGECPSLENQEKILQLSLTIADKLGLDLFIGYPF